MIAYRIAVKEDAAEVHDIYQHYVENTVITFRTKDQGVDEFEHKIASTIYPFWVAEAEGKVVGFAYADQIRPHDAYLWDVELTLYLHKDAPGRMGLGSRLYEKLLENLKAQGFRNAYGVITGSNEVSIHFHERFGFQEVARFENMGYKHGAWHDVVWMHKALGSLEGVPQKPKLLSEIIAEE